MVVANAGAALFAANQADSIRAAVAVAQGVIDRGEALALVERLKGWTNRQ